MHIGAGVLQGDRLNPNVTVRFWPIVAVRRRAEGVLKQIC